MVILDVDHPDIEEFVNWKKVEEEKAKILIANGFPADFNGEAYQTVSGQNSNNSVRVTQQFLQKVIEDGDWDLVERSTGAVRRTVKAQDVWRRIAEAAWACADPGMQYDTTINEWHTCPEGGRIRASNPCSEYMFLDNTACNLASLNLVKFYNDGTGAFDVEAYEHAIRVWTIVLEISVTMAQFPSKEIALGSYEYRTLGLGYANIGSLLMRSGIPYDSDEGRAIAGALTSILTGRAYATSAEMAAAIGPFARFWENRDQMLRVIRNHRRAAQDAPSEEYEGISHYVMSIDPAKAPHPLVQAARRVWDVALEAGESHGFRNAQATVLAPTGTIGLLMDCDTTGVEPDFALVKFKKLAGGGYFKIANQSIAPALRRLGYTEDQIVEIVRHVIGTMTLDGAPHINRETLTERGLDDETIERIEAALPSVFDLRHAFNTFVLGEEALEAIGIPFDRHQAAGFDLLASLGFSRSQVAEANDVICGRQTIEGAPGLAEEHLAVFDTANKNGKNGRRFIYHTGHIKMMAAAQPFISGAISKTINMPPEVTAEDIEGAYMLSADLGLKAMALYRDGSKASQPLSAAATDEGDDQEEVQEINAALAEEKAFAWGRIPAGVSPTEAYARGMQPPRFLLPARRGGFTQEGRIGGHKVFLRTGEYEDGTLGEVFIDLAKEGATLRGILSCFAIAVSKGLQYGVPLEEFVDTFTFQTFEPRGMVEGHPNIKMANSIVDYVFRALGVEYLHRDELAQVPPVREMELPEPAKGLAIEAGVQLDLTDAAMEDDIDVQVAAASFVDTTSSPNGAKTNPAPQPARAAVTVSAIDAGTAAAQSALAAMMGDAPLCETCGHITIRAGSCYKCLNCGGTTGCS
jgi:ribonucleoside-diphosphate reductase alpha chain